MFIRFYIFLGFLLTGCTNNDPFSSPADHSSHAQNAPGQTTGAKKGCQLPAQKYNVQSVVHYRASGAYELYLFGAPACFSQPFTTNDLMLSQLDDTTKEKALLEVGSQSPVLHMKSDFRIEIVDASAAAASGATGASTAASEGPSFWTPFLASAAGAAVGGAIASAMMRPKYYSPPPATARNAQGMLSGYSGAGETKDQAYRSYKSSRVKDSRIATKTQPEPRKRFFKKAPNTRKTSRGFFGGSKRKSFKRRR